MAAATTPGRPDYIRGGGGVRLDPRLVVTVLAAGVAVVVLVVSVSLAAATASANRRADRLRTAGVPVAATVTGCLGIGSGVGMGVEYWSCRASYVVGSRKVSATLAGSRHLLRDGQVVAARAVPGDPGSLTAVAAVPAATAHGSYLPPALLAVGGLALAGVAARAGRRRPAPGGRGPDQAAR